MNSLTYNNTDLSIYGLTVVGSKEALATALGYDTIQLSDRSYAGRPVFPPKTLKLPIAIKASSSAQLTTYIDNIKRVCAQLEEKELVLDAFNDRYWKARFNGISGERAGAIAFEGELDFTADDPLAYAVNLTDNDFDIDSDPKTITESVGGTICTKPLYTFTAGEELTDITLKVENILTGEELQWEGNLASGEVLTIDTELWIVKVEGVANMATVSGKFPVLVPATDNFIKITGFGSSGSLNIKYRNAYL